MKTIQFGLILISTITLGCNSRTSKKAAISAPPTHCDALASQPLPVPYLLSGDSILVGAGFVHSNGFNIDLGIINPGVRGVVQSSPQMDRSLIPPLQGSRRDLSLIDDTGTK